jgi:hypothetical protein
MTNEMTEPEDDETTQVETAAAKIGDPAALAWTRADEPVEPQRQSWRSTWGIAATALACGVLAGGVGAYLWATSKSTSAKPTVAPAVSAAPTPTKTVESGLDRDTRFFTLLAWHGVSSTNPVKTLAAARAPTVFGLDSRSHCHGGDRRLLHDRHE